MVDQGYLDALEKGADHALELEAALTVEGRDNMWGPTERQERERRASYLSVR